MDQATREFVRKRAGDRCEYCRLHQRHSPLRFHVEHIVARQHGGSSDVGNLALACHRCNLHKGPNIAGLDPLSKETVALYHPREDRWDEHFRMDGSRIEGLTRSGRATVVVLAMNDARRLELRASLRTD